jgi:hypothetical protein
MNTFYLLRFLTISLFISFMVTVLCTLFPILPYSQLIVGLSLILAIIIIVVIVAVAQPIAGFSITLYQALFSVRTKTLAQIIFIILSIPLIAGYYASYNHKDVWLIVGLSLIFSSIYALLFNLMHNLRGSVVLKK